MAAWRAGTDFLIIGSGIAGSARRRRSRRARPRHRPHQGRSDREQHRLRAGRHRRRASAPTIRPRSTSPTRWRPAMASATRTPCACSSRTASPTSSELLEWGAQFDRDRSGQPALGREGAHRVRRVLHARDATGREIGRLLWSRVAADPRVQRAQPHARGRPRSSSDGRCVGAEFAMRGRIAGVSTRRRCCWQRAAPARSSARRPTRRLPPATASRWRGARARASPISSSCSFIRPRSRCRARRGSCSRRRCAAKGRGSSTTTASDSCRATSAAASWRRATSCRARSSAKSSAPGGRCFCRCSISIPTGCTRAFRRSPTPAARSGLDLARDPIPVGPAAHYIMGGVETDVWGRTTLAGPLRGRRSRLHRRARRQSSRQQFAARRARLRRARGAGDAAAAGRPAGWPTCASSIATGVRRRRPGLQRRSTETAEAIDSRVDVGRGRATARPRCHALARPSAALALASCARRGADARAATRLRRAWPASRRSAG